MAVARLLFVCCLLVGILAYLSTKGTKLPAAGLEPAMEMLSIGASVSPQYYDKLTCCLQKASTAYDASFAHEPSIGTLRSELTKARAAVQELIWRAPQDSQTLERLQQGKDLMTAQLMAWVKDVKDRWKLLPAPHDSLHFWNRYYECST